MSKEDTEGTPHHQTEEGTPPLHSMFKEEPKEETPHHLLTEDQPTPETSQ